MTPYELLDLHQSVSTHSQAGRLLKVARSLRLQGITLRIDLESHDMMQAEERLVTDLRAAWRRTPTGLRYAIAVVSNGAWVAGADLTQLARAVPDGSYEALRTLTFRWCPSLAVAEATRVTLMAHDVPATWDGRADGPIVAE